MQYLRRGKIICRGVGCTHLITYITFIISKKEVLHIYTDGFLDYRPHIEIQHTRQTAKTHNTKNVSTPKILRKGHIQVRHCVQGLLDLLSMKRFGITK